MVLPVKWSRDSVQFHLTLEITFFFIASANE